MQTGAGPREAQGPRGSKRPKGPKGPSGPLGRADGAVGIIPNLFRMQVLSKGVKQRPAGSRVGTPADDVEPLLEVAVAKI